MNRAIELNPNDIEALYNKGVCLYFLSKHDQVKELLLKCTHIKPDLIESWLMLANTMSYLDNFDLAIQCYDKVIEIDSSNADALNNKGATLINLNRLDEALIYLNKAIELNSNDLEALNNKANCLFYLDKHEEALYFYDLVISIDNENYDAINNRENCLAYIKSIE